MRATTVWPVTMTSGVVVCSWGGTPRDETLVAGWHCFVSARGSLFTSGGSSGVSFTALTLKVITSGIGTYRGHYFSPSAYTLAAGFSARAY